MKLKFDKEKFLKDLHKVKYMVIGMFMILVAMSIVFVPLPNFLNNVVQLFLVQGSYKYMSISYSSDKLINDTVEFCYPFQNETQIDCVVNQIAPYYNYSKHDGFVRPDDFKNSSTVCRDIALIFDSVFTKLNWRTEFRFDVPNHVYNGIMNQDMYCWVDAEDYKCW